MASELPTAAEVSLACDEPTVALAEPVRASLDPQGRGRQHIAARLVQLVDTRAGGFFLTREKPAGN